MKKFIHVVYNRLIKRPRYVVLLVLALLIILGGFAVFGGKKNEAETVIVKRAVIQDEVSVTGRVKASEEVKLALEKSGRIIETRFKVGDRVSIGATLLRIDNRDLYAKRQQALAKVAREESKLSELRQGTRPEEIIVEEAKVADAEGDVAKALGNLRDEIQGSYSNVDDAIRNKIDQFISNPKSNNPILNFTTDTQARNDIENGRFKIEKLLVEWKSDVSGDVNTVLSESVALRTDIDEIKTFLSKIASAVNNLTPSASFSLSTITGWKTDVAAARTDINTMYTSFIEKEEALKSATFDAILATKRLELLKAGSRPETIKAQEAALLEVKAEVQAIDADIEKTLIRAPFRGVITKLDAKRGEIYAANTVLVSMMSDAAFQVEAFVPEAAISKLQIGKNAAVTLDAYGKDEEYGAKVVAVDPAETFVDGVATYKVTLAFVTADPKIKSGMTANVDVVAERKENVLAVPLRAIIQDGDKKKVRIQKGEVIEEAEVTVGIRGSDGNVEIVSGLEEGEIVLIP